MTALKSTEETSFWHWKSRDVGGKAALDYLIKVEGVKFVEAVLALCEESPGYIPPVSQPEQKGSLRFLRQRRITAGCLPTF